LSVVDREVSAFRQQIADLAQERLIGRHVRRRTVCAVPDRRSFRCNSSRLASSARFFGARSLAIAEKPDQNASSLTPVPGSASLLMKAYSAGATFRPRISI
jgi:hypothetical protein